jgi:hypothetical protein
MPYCYNFRHVCRFDDGVRSSGPTSRANSTSWPMPSAGTSTAAMGINAARASRLCYAFACSPFGCTTWRSRRTCSPRSLGRQLTAHFWHWLATIHEFLYTILVPNTFFGSSLAACLVSSAFLTQPLNHVSIPPILSPASADRNLLQAQPSFYILPFSPLRHSPPHTHTHRLATLVLRLPSSSSRAKITPLTVA